MVIVMRLERHQTIRALFDNYIEQYASRDERLIACFSEDFSGYTGGGDFLVKDRATWVKITLHDFAQVPNRIRIEMKDISMQDLSPEVVVVTAFFHIHLPILDHILSNEMARLTLIFHLENEAWKIAHSGISIPYNLVQDGEVYPLNRLQERNRELETLVEERTKALLESESLYRLLTEDVSDVVWKTDHNFFITYISPSDQRLRGFEAREVIGRHISDLFTNEGIAILTEAIKKNKMAELDGIRMDFLSLEVPHRCKNGHVIWGELFSNTERDEQGTIIGYHGITRDITERKAMQDQVRSLAFYDPLTNLPNRRLLHDRLSRILAASERSACYGALIFIDLDHFKPLNDQYGHHVGDLLLIEVANRLTQCIREADTVARFGGDEFVVVLNELDIGKEESIRTAYVVAEKIHKSLQDRYLLTIKREGKKDTWVEHDCSASMGMVVFLGHNASQGEILNRADKAMYQAKELGRNSIQIYTD